MHRFYIGREDFSGKYIKTSDKDLIKHAKKTLRLKVGDPVVLFDGHGTEYNGDLAAISNSGISFEITAENFYEKPKRAEIWLGQAATQAGKSTDIIRMNTEIGVDGFVFFNAQYSQGKVKPDKAERHLKLIEEAARQSERVYLPKVIYLDNFKKLFEEDFTKYVFLTARDYKNSKNIYEFKKGLELTDKLLVCIGPEGGFSPEELAFAEKHEASFVHLDMPILRTQTAGVVVNSLLLQS